MSGWVAQSDRPAAAEGITTDMPLGRLSKREIVEVEEEKGHVFVWYSAVAEFSNYVSFLGRGASEVGYTFKLSAVSASPHSFSLACGAFSVDSDKSTAHHRDTLRND